MTRKDEAKVDLSAANAATIKLNEGAGERSEVRPGSAPSRAPLVRDLIAELSRRERLVLMLRYTEELTIAEIAAVLEMAVTEVERVLFSVAERVRRRVQPAQGVYGRRGFA